MKIILVFLNFHENKITVFLYFMPESSHNTTQWVSRDDCQQPRLNTNTTVKPAKAQLSLYECEALSLTCAALEHANKHTNPQEEPKFME